MLEFAAAVVWWVGVWVAASVLALAAAWAWFMWVEPRLLRRRLRDVQRRADARRVDGLRHGGGGWRNP